MPVASDGELSCETGCDSLYDGVYRLADDGSETHCINEQRRHLYLGPTGKWYLNSVFTPEADTCKAFYHRKKITRRPSLEGIGLPVGEHRWQCWQAGAWEEKTVQIEAVSPAADAGNLSKDAATDQLIPETASASARQSEAPNGTGQGKKGKGRFEQWLADSQAASLSPPARSGEEGVQGVEGLVPRGGHLATEAESSGSEDGETVLVDHTPVALRRKKRKKKGGGCCGSRPQQDEEPKRQAATKPEPEPQSAPEPQSERELESPKEQPDLRQSFGRRGD